MPIQISSGAQEVIKAMQLPSDQETKIKECISKYTMPNNFSGILSWIAFQIKNAVLRVFCMKSEWQKAKSLIVEEFHKRVKENKVITEFLEKHPSTKKTIENRLEKRAQFVAVNLLSNCLIANQEKAESSGTLEKLLEKQTIDFAVKQMEDVCKKLEQEKGQEKTKILLAN